jgi:hypothetical protein
MAAEKNRKRRDLRAATFQVYEAWTILLKAGKIETLAVPVWAAILEGANGNESIIVN